MTIKRIWLIGCGNMAGAMLRRWLDCGLDPATVTVVRPSGAPVANGVRVVNCVPDEPAPDLLLIGVKPQMLADVASGLQTVATGTILSILAGTRLASLRETFPHAAKIVRAMPNLPVALGQGVVATVSDAPVDADVAALLAQLGLVEHFPDETLFDAVTALAGSGPAFTYRFVDALAKGGTALGLDPTQASRLALATTQGALALARQGDAPLADLADRVTSKGGSTRAGRDVLDTALDDLVARTLAASTKRNAELGG
ncbi:MAG TPA: pyrroline-5-carboxylate reductase [Sphingomonas sp.]|jgi:pyrroline-5-carboxylate reductase|nr:pyrroline-5-carboxylate reductase [Sphingomonas sp.]